MDSEGRNLPTRMRPPDKRERPKQKSRMQQTYQECTPPSAHSQKVKDLILNHQLSRDVSKRYVFKGGFFGQ